MARKILGPHPKHHDTDAGGSCRYLGCSYNSDEAHWEALARGEDVYGYDGLTDEQKAIWDAGMLEEDS